MIFFSSKEGRTARCALIIPYLFIQREPLADRNRFLFDRRHRRLPFLDDPRDHIPDLPHLRLLHPPRRRGRRAEAHPARLRLVSGIERNRVLIRRDIRHIQQRLQP